MSSCAAKNLYRSLLREAKQVSDYNYRSYAVRRTKAGFDMNRSLQGEEAMKAISHGEKQLHVLHRQRVIGGLYPSGKSVMEQAM